MSPTSQGQNTPRLLKSSGIITIFSLLGIISGLATQVILARWFGAGIELDAYYAASSIPNLFALVLTSSLNIVFVPIFINYRSQNSEQEAWLLASSVINILLLGLGLITLVVWLASPVLVRWLVPGYSPDSEAYRLTWQMFVIQWPIVLFSALTGLLSGIFYAQNRFWQPSAAPAISSGTILLFTLLFYEQWGILSTAVGSLVGPILQCMLMVPILWQNNHYRAKIAWKHAGVREVIRLSTPWIAASTFSKASTVIETILTSFLPTGSLTYLSYSYRLISLAVNLVSRGISISIFPRISTSYVDKNSHEFRILFSMGMRYIGFLTIPVTGLLIVFRNTIVQILLQGDNFTQADVVATGWAIAYYSGGLVSMALGAVVSNAFYARKDTITPAAIGVISILPQTLLAYYLLPLLSYLALAISFAIAANAKLLTMIYFLWRKTEGIDGLNIMQSFGRMILSTLVTSLIIAFVLQEITPYADTKIGLLIILTSLTSLSILFYGSSMYLLKSPEMELILQRIKQSGLF